MMTERGVAVDHSTIYRWVQRFAPEMEKRLRWQWRRARSGSWRVDETYVRVRGKWAYLYRVVDKFGDTIDFYLSATRNTKAAKRFLGKALRGWKDWELPEVVNTDKAPTGAIAELKAEGKCPQDTRHRQVKYLNKVPQQCRRGRPWQAQAAHPPGARVQDAEDRLRHDQGLRGDASAAQRVRLESSPCRTASSARQGSSSVPSPAIRKGKKNPPPRGEARDKHGVEGARDMRYHP